MARVVGGSLDGIDNQDLIKARVDDAVSRILQKLPPLYERREADEHRTANMSDDR